MLQVKLVGVGIASSGGSMHRGACGSASEMRGGEGRRGEGRGE
jgi:hypothetical protein